MGYPGRNSSLDFLLVDDNPGDIRIAKEVFESAEVAADLSGVVSADEAFDFLHHRNEYRDAVRPDIILLDLDLPAVDGLEVLEKLRADPELTALPVIILTGSDYGKDVLRGYELGATAYLNKPGGIEEYADMVRHLVDFWAMAYLPSADESDRG